MKNTYKRTTLVDYVENAVIEYIKANHLEVGDSLPSEIELCSELGVARSVLRESLSRLKMLGVIESRPSRGMTVKEPSIFEPVRKIISMNVIGRRPMLDVLQLRIALEIGMVDSIFSNLTSQDVSELTRIVNVGIALEDNEYEDLSDIQFHSKLYEITRNESLIIFQDILQPVMTFVKKDFAVTFGPINRKLQEEGKIVTHADLLEHIRNHDKEAFRKALTNHFLPYSLFIEKKMQTQ